ncbi:MAG TPA: nucleotidyltransferase domain-containing protein [Methylomirabilota bacterium]|nr:nucleotidyltransferase domain-containing protein [Methylomirabilota bacterium]
MRLHHGLDDLFATGSHVRVLRALAQLPHGLTVSGREIARRAGVSQPTTLEVLRSLDRQGLLVIGRRPRAAFYRLNPEHVLTPVVQQLFDREDALRGELEGQLAAVVSSLPGVKEVTLFGSAARGDMGPESDLDVAVRSTRDVPDEIPALQAIQRRFGNKVNVIRLRERGARGLREAVKREGRSLGASPRRKAR